jgi:hypothetical protein
MEPDVNATRARRQALKLIAVQKFLACPVWAKLAEVMHRAAACAKKVRGGFAPLSLNICDLCRTYQRKRMASCMMRGVTSPDGLPKPPNFNVPLKSLSTRPLRKSEIFKACPFAPR